jgi:hypothetical protein
LTWISSDENVATVSTNGIITGVSAGHAIIDVSGGVPTFDWRGEGFDACGDAVGTCNPGSGDFFDLQADVFVKPKITSISPAQGAVGDTIAVTIAGVGMTTGATVNAGTGITATVTSSSNSQVQVNFVVSASATGGNRNVTVSANGQTSNSMTFFVQVPTSLSVLPGGVSVISTCPSGSDFPYGIKVSVRYQINDQNGQGIVTHQSNLYDPMENNTVVTTTSSGTSTATSSGHVGNAANGTNFADTNGQFTDSPVGACAIISMTATLTQIVNINIGSYSSPTIRTNVYSIVSSSGGHGTISNGTDVTASR